MMPSRHCGCGLLIGQYVPCIFGAVVRHFLHRYVCIYVCMYVCMYVCILINLRALFSFLVYVQAQIIIPRFTAN